ncbi:hypothetical protein DFH09DRAFT_1354005 [Mycena vulgaris]|nr:hypothetical protein DFH09DRAFT_1354005 [Mycena vulgaris]
MSICFDSSVLSSFANTQDFDACAPTQARKARPLSLIVDHSPSIDTDGVSPDFDCRSTSPVSDCSQSSQSSDDTARSTIVGFGRKRHSVLPTVPPGVPVSTVVGFGRKQHKNRHSIAAAPSASTNPDRKREDRRSLPIPGDINIQRASLHLGSTHTPVIAIGTDVRPARVLQTARKVSDTILGNTTRQPPKPFLLPQLVEARGSLPSRVKRCLVAIASAPRVKSLVRRFSALCEMRLKPLNIGRQVPDSDEKEEDTDTDTCTWRGLLASLTALLHRRLRDIIGF